MEFIREGPTWLPSSSNMERAIQRALEGPLWFLPVPKEMPGAPMDAALEKTNHERALQGCIAAAKYFGWPAVPTKVALDSVASLQRWFREQLPSLESFQMVEHTPSVTASWILYLLKSPKETHRMGPKWDVDDPAFVAKIESTFGPLSALSSFLDQCQQDAWTSYVSENSVVALPPGCLHYDHFMKNYVSDETTRASLEAQCVPHVLKARDLGIPAKRLKSLLFVNPEPIHETKDFEVLLCDAPILEDHKKAFM